MLLSLDAPNIECFKKEAFAKILKNKRKKPNNPITLGELNGHVQAYFGSIAVDPVKLFLFEFILKPRPFEVEDKGEVRNEMIRFRLKESQILIEFESETSESSNDEVDSEVQFHLAIIKNYLQLLDPNCEGSARSPRQIQLATGKCISDRNFLRYILGGYLSLESTVTDAPDYASFLMDKDVTFMDWDLIRIKEVTKLSSCLENWLALSLNNSKWLTRKSLADPENMDEDFEPLNLILSVVESLSNGSEISLKDLSVKVPRWIWPSSYRLELGEGKMGIPPEFVGYSDLKSVLLHAASKHLIRAYFNEDEGTWYFTQNSSLESRCNEKFLNEQFGCLVSRIAAMKSARKNLYLSDGKLKVPINSWPSIMNICPELGTIKEETLSWHRHWREMLLSQILNRTKDFAIAVKMEGADEEASHLDLNLSFSESERQFYLILDGNGVSWNAFISDNDVIKSLEAMNIQGGFGEWFSEYFKAQSKGVEKAVPYDMSKLAAALPPSVVEQINSAIPLKKLKDQICWYLCEGDICGHFESNANLFIYPKSREAELYPADRRRAFDPLAVAENAPVTFAEARYYLVKFVVSAKHEPCDIADLSMGSKSAFESMISFPALSQKLHASESGTQTKKRTKTESPSTNVALSPSKKSEISVSGCEDLIAPNAAATVPQTQAPSESMVPLKLETKLKRCLEAYPLKYLLFEVASMHGMYDDSETFPQLVVKRNQSEWFIGWLKA